MNSFRVISNVKLIASNVCTKKPQAFAHGFCLLPLYHQISVAISTNHHLSKI